MATIDDSAAEPSGIRWAAGWLRQDAWVLTAQTQGTFIDEAPLPDGTWLRREDGQLHVTQLPASQGYIGLDEAPREISAGAPTRRCGLAIWRESSKSSELRPASAV